MEQKNPLSQLLATCATKKQVVELLNEFYHSTTFTFEDGVVANSKGVVNSVKVEKKKGRYRIMLG